MNWNEDDVTAPRFGDDITYWWDLDGSDLDFEEEIEEWEADLDTYDAQLDGLGQDGEVVTAFDDDDEEFGGRPSW